MPCWYYDKKELRNTPSARDGIDFTVEARYRKEGARFIIDCGTKLGLRYDSCATGVVFFHRFYMFHSFKEFHRYVTAACCLFLAGKTEETPKKCKDIIKTTRGMLTDAQMIVFGDDPKEEVMTMERILLQTIKFDLMVEHPYAYLLKFAKLIKGKGSEADKAKVQKLVQMAWTFINDSMCTMLCLQWEPEVIAISLMYLAARLNKSDVTDWSGKPSTFKGKWWEALVEDVNQELLEDVCHQVLDLYQPSPAAKTPRDDTPPPPPPKPAAQPAVTKSKRSRSPQTSESTRGKGPTPAKVSREEKRPVSPTRSSTKDGDRGDKQAGSRGTSAPSGGKAPRQPTNSGPLTPGTKVASSNTPTTSYSQNNPYMSQNMYSSSFMSQEGSQSIQSLVGGRATYGGYTQPAPAQPQPPTVAATPVSTTTSYSKPQSYQQPPYQPPAYQQPAQNYQPPPPSAPSYSQSSSYTPSYNYPPPTQQPYTPPNQQYQSQQTPLQSYGQNYSSGTSQYSSNSSYQSNYSYNSQNYQAPPYQQSSVAQPPMSAPSTQRSSGAVPPVRIMGRPP